jgi:hypothetical protein
MPSNALPICRSKAVSRVPGRPPLRRPSNALHFSAAPDVPRNRRHLLAGRSGSRKTAPRPFESVLRRQKMPQGVQSYPSELERIVEHKVRERTGRHVQNLRVELMDRQIVVRGSAQSYYVKLLALEAVREVRALICPVSLLVDIDVT